jgi:epoxyqueuosine reductase
MSKKEKNYTPNQYFLDKFPAGKSGNKTNGLNEGVVRQASPFFWHKPELQEFGELQTAVINHHRKSPEISAEYSSGAHRGPAYTELQDSKSTLSTEQATKNIKEFVLANEGDLVGIVPLDPLWVYEGFEIKEPWVILIGVAMDHQKLNQAPASFENPTAGVEVAEKYNQASRTCRNLVNYISSQGYDAKAFPGPFATALNMIPAAIAAGLGELGKHGSMINREFGSNFRLSAVTTDLPLLSDQPDEFGADWFCHRCQVCTNACPPDAIHSEKQLVRGVEKWFVDFDKCIPYFGETMACGICIARCPWSTPERAPKLAEKWTRRLDKENAEKASQR